jgi:ABC-2 type transport system permease protein
VSGWWAVLYRELLILKRKLGKQLASMAVAPLLYLLAFGLALGREVTVMGRSYVEFLIPGLVAMSSMSQAFGIASEINLARFYYHIFEEFQAAPLSHTAYVTGEVLAGILRGLLAVVVILLLALTFGVILSYSGWFWLGVLLNSWVFASLAVCLAMLVQSHADQALLMNFVITPMAFLGGTFFPLERMPLWVQKLLLLLPITHAAAAIRSAAFGQTPPWQSLAILAGLGLLAFFAAVFCVRQAKN